MEEALRSTSERLTLATGAAGVGIWDWDVVSNVLIWDNQMYQLYGITADRFADAYEAWEAGLHPEDLQRGRDEVQQALRGENEFDTAFRVIWPDKTVRYIRGRATVERDAGGAPLRMIGANWDITDVRLAVEGASSTLRELERLKTALDEHSIVACTNVKGEITSVNDKFCAISKYSRDELLRRDHRIINSGHHSKEFIRELWTTIVSGNIWKGEMKNRAKDGSFYWVDTTIVPFLDAEGRPFQYVAIRTDITERKASEEILAQENMELEETALSLQRIGFEHSPVAQIYWDTGFQITAWNRAAERLFGYTRAEALGHHARLLVPAEAVAAVDAIGSQLLANTATMSTNENVRKDGHTLTCEWHNAPLTSADETVEGVSSVILDVTERARLQGALVQSQKMDAMGHLAGGVAHDFNNILGVIAQYGGFLQDALPQGDERRDDIIEVLKAADRGAGLTRQLLAFTRQQPTDKRPTDLNQRLAELHRLLGSAVGDSVELSISPSARPAVVRIDPVQFDQILLNLVVNARDAMPSGGRLRIALEHVGIPADSEHSIRGNLNARFGNLNASFGVLEHLRSRSSPPIVRSPRGDRQAQR